MSTSTRSPSSRNAPCPCGSGRRYKDCHGGLQAGQAPAAELAASELLNRSRAALAQSKPEAAEGLLRRLLEHQPGNAAAWNLLGEALLSRDPAAATGAWWQALRLDPEKPEASFHLGNRHREAGEPRAAAIHYERALRSAPGNAGVLNNLGLVYAQLGSVEQAEQCYRAALASEPQHAHAAQNLAKLLSRRAQ